MIDVAALYDAAFNDGLRPDPLLTVSQWADQFRMLSQTASAEPGRWRSEGRGPRYLKLSKRVSYPLDAVVDFERYALHDSTSERAVR